MEVKVNDLTVWYKYVATMTFVKRTYSHFKESMREKIPLICKGKLQIHVVPFYFHESGVYYQPIFDFDKCDDKLEVLAFINTVLHTNKVRINDIFVELSPHGIHVGLKYAYGPIDYLDIKTIRDYVRQNIEPRFKHLDAVSSVRLMAISRTPSYLKQRRMVAFEVNYFKQKSMKFLRNMQKSLKTITVKFAKDQLDHYLFLHGIKDALEAPNYVLEALGL
jgi:uncharacterized protein (DUF2164 family)